MGPLSLDRPRFLSLKHLGAVEDAGGVGGGGGEIEGAATLGGGDYRPLVAPREGFVEALGHRASGALGALLVEDLLGHGFSVL